MVSVDVTWNLEPLQAENRDVPWSDCSLWLPCRERDSCRQYESMRGQTEVLMA